MYSRLPGFPEGGPARACFFINAMMYATMIPVINELIDSHEESVSMLKRRISGLDLTDEEDRMAGELLDRTNETIRELYALRKEIYRYEKNNDR